MSIAEQDKVLDVQVARLEKALNGVLAGLNTRYAIDIVSNDQEYGAGFRPGINYQISAGECVQKKIWELFERHSEQLAYGDISMTFFMDFNESRCDSILSDLEARRAEFFQAGVEDMRVEVRAAFEQTNIGTASIGVRNAVLRKEEALLRSSSAGAEIG